MKSDEWKEVRLGDICDMIFSGGTPETKKLEYWDGTLCWLSSGETRNRYIYKTEKTISENAVKNSSTKLSEKNDIVIASAGQGTTRGQVSFCKIDTYINQSLICVRVKKEVIDSKFIFFNLTNRYNELRQISDGNSIRGSLTTAFIKNFKVILPPLPEQKAIADTLSCIDDKIENNNRMNKVLEEMAQAIFKSWFIDFEPFKDGEFVDSELGRIPKGWRVGTLGEECECVLGGTPSRVKDNYWGGDIPWINSSKTNEFRIILPSEYITEEGLNNSSTSILPKKTIVLAITGATLGQFSILEIESCANQSVVGIKQNDLISYQYIYNTIFYNINNIINNQTGGAQQHINKGIIEKTKILIPINNILEKFNNITENIYESIAINCFENLKLSTLRDTLLPKLMSGEIRVPYEENTKEE